MPAKILVVEDNSDARDLWAALFKLDGYTVVTARDGADGIRKAGSNRPDLIVTDIGMPLCDGVEMIRSLRSQPEFKDVPIIVITAFGKDEAAAAIEAGADKVMFKPLSFESLTEAVRSLLGSIKNLD